MNKINNNCSSLLKSKLIKDSLKKKHQISLRKYKINNSPINSQKKDNLFQYNNNLNMNTTFQNQNENIIQSKNKINNSKLENYIKNFLQKKKMSIKWIFQK